MNTDKSIIMRAFNKLFFEFMDDVISVYPENVDILSGKESFLTIKKLNPTGIIKVWFSTIYAKYQIQIDEGDIRFFMEKDYSSDITNPKDNHILEIINNFRDPIKNMNADNTAHVTKYIQDLSKLSVAYASIA
jgi:hypothetical protein